MKHLLYLLLCLLLFAACKKHEIKTLPPATTTGANTMGAIVDKKAWIANGGVGFQPPSPVTGGYTRHPNDETRNNVYIRAHKTDLTKINLYLREVSKPGKYLLDTSTKVFIDGVTQSFNYGIYYVPGKVYMTNSSHTGKVIITRADTVNGIISGFFDFTAAHGGETVTVTHGRFDLKSGTR